MRVCSLCGQSFTSNIQKCPTCGGDIIHLPEKRKRFFDKYLFDDGALRNISFSSTYKIIKKYKYVLVIAIIVIVIGLIYYDAENKRQYELLMNHLVTICAQEPTHGDDVDDLLHIIGDPNIWKAYIDVNGDVYRTHDDWVIQQIAGEFTVYPAPNIEHYCWTVHWFQGANDYVFWIDRDTEPIIDTWWDEY